VTYDVLSVILKVLQAEKGRGHAAQPVAAV
jgi:hypothetical protein